VRRLREDVHLYQWNGNAVAYPGRANATGCLARSHQAADHLDFAPASQSTKETTPLVVKLTNRFNLPEPFVAAVAADDYERGTADYTTTELIKPVRIVAYERKHWDEMVEDVSDRVWAFSGQVKHVVLERIAKTNPERYMVEQRFEVKMQTGGKKISGKIDLFDRLDRTLYDWKETSVWKFILGDTNEWEKQGNINLFLMRMNDVLVKHLVNIALLKDWKARMARTTKKKDYPKCAINVKPLPMWTVGEQQDYILKRIAAHEKDAVNPPVCTKEERWQRDAEFAVMKRGKKNAVERVGNSDLAQAKASLLGPEYYVQERKVEPVRCLDFCPVWKWCDFGVKAREYWERP
jgi:hypothetical protein